MSAEALWPAVGSLGCRYGLTPRQRSQLQALLEQLAEDPRAPTSVRAPDAAVDVHLADSLVALEIDVLAGAGKVVDVGSGAGFPGLALAIALPDAQVSLLESQARKCAYLERAIVRAGLGNARVVHGRAEQWRDGLDWADVATARAVAPQPAVLEYAAPLLVVGGVLIDWRTRSTPAQDVQAATAAEQLGLQRLEVRRVHPFPGSRNRTLHLYSKVSPTPPRFPRRPGSARRRPLGSGAQAPAP
jgi:16S rRNA (guanine527-N7)-methyltransferase